eukprot:9351544-Alexandrium_andersonii.AAC.1
MDHRSAIFSKHITTNAERVVARFQENGSRCVDWQTGRELKSVGFFSLVVRDGQPSQLRHIGGAVVDIPGTMATLAWMIEDNLSLAKAHLVSGGLQQVNCLSLFKQGASPCQSSSSW